MRNLLAHSKNFKLYGAYEEAQLEGFGIEKHVVVGDFYGDVVCGCIDYQERWCISGGNGIVIYNLTIPLRPYKYKSKESSWAELWRDDQVWYPEAIYQVEDEMVRIVVDVYSEAKGVYELNVKTLEFIKRV